MQRALIIRAPSPGPSSDLNKTQSLPLFASFRDRILCPNVKIPKQVAFAVFRVLDKLMLPRFVIKSRPVRRRDASPPYLENSTYYLAIDIDSRRGVDTTLDC